jgi:hypothetical protein
MYGSQQTGEIFFRKNLKLLDPKKSRYNSINVLPIVLTIVSFISSLKKQCRHKGLSTVHSAPVWLWYGWFNGIDFLYDLNILFERYLHILKRSIPTKFQISKSVGHFSQAKVNPEHWLLVQ